MDIIRMYFSSIEGVGSFYTSSYSMNIQVFGLVGGRHTKQSKKASEVHTVWLNELENQFQDEELPDVAYLVAGLGLFKTETLEKKAIKRA